MKKVFSGKQLSFFGYKYFLNDFHFQYSNYFFLIFLAKHDKSIFNLIIKIELYNERYLFKKLNQSLDQKLYSAYKWH